MRIAYLINQYPKVSHSFIRREINALERQGLEIFRLSLRGWDEQLPDEQDRIEQKLTRYVLADGFFPLVIAAMRVAVSRPIRCIGVLRLAWRMSRQSERALLTHFIYMAEACRIFFWLREAKIQHLHAHFGTNPAEIAMMVHRLGGPPWSFTVHGPEEFDKAGPLHLAEKIVDSRFVIAISSYGRSQLFRLVMHNFWQKIHVVHCGLNSDFFVPLNRATAVKRLVCVGRLSEQKGHLLLMEAARDLSKQADDFELVLVGDGELRQQIECLIVQYNLSDHVRITGWLNEQQVRNELLSARALVLASFAEGLPVVIMEAMAMQRPIVATMVAGIPELVQPGRNGWLVPAGDCDGLMRAMRICLETPTERLLQMGKAAQIDVAARHNINDAAAKLYQLFHQAAARG